MGYYCEDHAIGRNFRLLQGIADANDDPIRIIRRCVGHLSSDKGVSRRKAQALIIFILFNVVILTLNEVTVAFDVTERV